MLLVAPAKAIQSPAATAIAIIALSSNAYNPITCLHFVNGSEQKKTCQIADESDRCIMTSELCYLLITGSTHRRVILKWGVRRAVVTVLATNPYETAGP